MALRVGVHRDEVGRTYRPLLTCVRGTRIGRRNRTFRGRGIVRRGIGRVRGVETAHRMGRARGRLVNGARRFERIVGWGGRGRETGRGIGVGRLGKNTGTRLLSWHRDAGVVVGRGPGTGGRLTLNRSFLDVPPRILVTPLLTLPRPLGSVSTSVRPSYANVLEQCPLATVLLVPPSSPLTPLCPLWILPDLPLVVDSVVPSREVVRLVRPLNVLRPARTFRVPRMGALIVRRKFVLSLLGALPRTSGMTCLLLPIFDCSGIMVIARPPPICSTPTSRLAFVATTRPTVRKNTTAKPQTPHTGPSEKTSQDLSFAWT